MVVGTSFPPIMVVSQTTGTFLLQTMCGNLCFIYLLFWFLIAENLLPSALCSEVVFYTFSSVSKYHSFITACARLQNKTQFIGYPIGKHIL